MSGGYDDRSYLNVYRNTGSSSEEVFKVTN